MEKFRPTKIVVHHSATVDGSTYSWDDIKRYHVETLGWRDIGYHAGVEKIENDYAALIGRSWVEVGAHCEGHNTESLGICVVGNYDITVPDERALRLCARIVAMWIQIFGIAVSEVYRHSDFSPKTCPGRLFPWQRFLEMVKEEIELLGGE